jgi:hypothetical protein
VTIADITKIATIMIGMNGMKPKRAHGGIG